MADKSMLAVIAENAVLMTAVWGGLGGLTNALVTRAERREALRLILLGALIAAGMGSLAGAILAAMTGLPASAMVPAGGGVGASAFTTGIFGSAIIEVIMARIKKWRVGE